MMQMLGAGGMALLTDHERKADTDNPRGYCEWEPVKQLPKQPELIAQAEGKAVKVITQLLLALPAGHDYKVVFMERPLPEVLLSQDEMLRRRGSTDTVPHDVLTGAFQDHLKKVNAWLEGKPHVAVQRLSYHAVLRDPKAASNTVQAFLGIPLDVEAMAREVDPKLYRQRA